MFLLLTNLILMLLDIDLGSSADNHLTLAEKIMAYVIAPIGMALFSLKIDLSQEYLQELANRKHRKKRFSFADDLFETFEIDGGKTTWLIMIIISLIFYSLIGLLEIKETNLLIFVQISLLILVILIRSRRKP